MEHAGPKESIPKQRLDSCCTKAPHRHRPQRPDRARLLGLALNLWDWGSQKPNPAENKGGGVVRPVADQCRLPPHPVGTCRCNCHCSYFSHSFILCQNRRDTNNASQTCPEAGNPQAAKGCGALPSPCCPPRCR